MPTPSEPRAILLVEDNPDDELLAQRAFRALGPSVEVRTARDGAEAVEIVERGEFPANLILLDLKLPKLSGLEVLARIRKSAKYAYVPVVVLSSSNEMSDIGTAYQLRANSFVQKPVDFDSFVMLIRNLGHFWLGINECS